MHGEQNILKNICRFNFTKYKYWMETKWRET